MKYYKQYMNTLQMTDRTSGRRDRSLKTDYIELIQLDFDDFEYEMTEKIILCVCVCYKL